MNKPTRTQHSSDRPAKTKASSKASRGRIYAWELLEYIRLNNCFLSRAFAKVEKPQGISSEDEAFGRLLATTVVTHGGCLDKLINLTLSKPSDIKPKVRNALRISFAELFYLEKPAYAVIDQGVHLVRFAMPKAAGVGNYSLRRAQEMLPHFAQVKRDETREARAMHLGFPEWLYARLETDLGAKPAYALCTKSNDPAPLFFMVNQAKASTGQVLDVLRKQQVAYSSVALPVGVDQAFETYCFDERSSLSNPAVSKLLRQGKIIISDASAQAIAQLAVPESEPDRFLEIGAGRGTKSVLMQNTALSRFGRQMVLDTVDVNSFRSDERKERLAALGIDEAIQYVQDAAHLLNLKKESYQTVFIDAPCSGLGTLRRHPDIRWRLKAEHIDDLAQVGFDILKAAAPLVQSGGRLVYATCTVLNRENDEVIQAFLETNVGKHFTKSFSATTGLDAASFACDSHYVCVLERD